MIIKENYRIILEKIEKACHRSKMDPKEIQVLGVCKGQTTKKIKEALDCGIRILGENKLQEAEIHMKELSKQNVEWHFIGRMQKNKINRILNLFHLIQSVDGVKSLEHIHKRIESEVNVFIEINIGEEKSKSGFTLDGLLKALPYISNLNKVKITGLMTMPPYFEDPELVRPYFSRMKKLQDEINVKQIANFQIKNLSMGMSNDYETAIEEGATIIRLGTALFGRRVE